MPSADPAQWRVSDDDVTGKQPSGAVNHQPTSAIAPSPHSIVFDPARVGFHRRVERRASRIAALRRKSLPIRPRCAMSARPQQLLAQERNVFFERQQLC
jgi:hypothetical protein